MILNLLNFELKEVRVSSGARFSFKFSSHQWHDLSVSINLCLFDTLGARGLFAHLIPNSLQMNEFECVLLAGNGPSGSCAVNAHDSRG